LSSYSYLTHNGAYLSFILYLVGTGKTDQWVLCFYYFMGISQNLLIFAMKRYYERQNKITDSHVSVHNREIVPFFRTAAGGTQKGAPAGEGIGHRREQYLQRRLWYKARREEYSGENECRLKMS
jgi:hypothetical protein